MLAVAYELYQLFPSNTFSYGNTGDYIWFIVLDDKHGRSGNGVIKFWTPQEYGDPDPIFT